MSALIIQMRDLAQVLPIIIQLGLFATPVIWQFSLIPAKWQFVYGFFNPLGPVIDDARRAMLLGWNPVPGPLLAAIAGTIVLPGCRLSALQAVRGELCRHCLKGPSVSSTCGRSSAPTARHRSSTTRSSGPRRSLTRGGGRPYRWVLKDVSVSVEPGGTLGLIGINGSGKTTLLKIISETTTSQPAAARRRVAWVRSSA